MSLFGFVSEVAKLPISASATVLTGGMEAIVRDKEEPFLISNVKNAAKEFSDMFD